MKSDYSGGQHRADKRYAISVRDEKILDLYTEYTSFPNRGASWEFQSRAIAEAVRVFGGNYNWFSLQDTNPELLDWSYKFVLDTLKFIATGKRSLDIYSWDMLISDDPLTGMQLVDNRQDVQNLLQELGLTISTLALIQRWVMQPNGFNDLMWTMHLLFGRASKRLK
jgi:hypothetical protein